MRRRRSHGPGRVILRASSIARALPCLLAALTLGSGCLVKKIAVNSLASTLASGGDVFTSDNDPQLVREAIPFALKTYESLLAESPRHRDLLVATARGFTQYAYGFILHDAEVLEATDLDGAMALRRRVRRLLLRGRDYGLRALEVRHSGLTAELRHNRLDGLAATTLEDVPALFWTGASWGAAISVLKDDAELIGDLSAVEALLRRVITLDEAFDAGAAHEAMMSLEATLAGGSRERAQDEFERAVELSGGALASPYVGLAETVAVQTQDKALFRELLGKALAVDVNAVPSSRLPNLLAQRRARWLLARTDELFFE